MVSEKATMEIIISVLASIVTILVGIGGGGRWIYRRGQESGKAQAEREAERRAQAEAHEKIKTLEGELLEIRAELDLIRTRRSRTSSL
jgi:hypothetical protein